MFNNWFGFQTPGRTIAIGDVHGYARPLQALFDLIEPAHNDTIVMLGDLIDRGPDAKQVIQMIKKFSKTCTIVTLMGNHEEILYNILTDPLYASMNFEDWNSWGGAQTLASFGVQWPHELPKSIRKYLAKCRPYYLTPKYWFAHANYNPYLPFEDMRADTLVWKPVFATFDYPIHQSGRFGFVGHSAQKNGEILKKEGLWCIDTYLYGGGCLTAVDVETRETWQVTRDGKPV